MSNVRRHMPNYAWICGACSQRNEPQTEQCSLCSCPAASSFRQRKAYQAALNGTGPPIRPVAAETVPPEVYHQLVRIRRTVTIAFIVGVVVSFALSYVLLRYWNWSSSKAGVASVGFLALAVTFGPCAIFLSRLRCPRCSEPWLSQAHSRERNGAFMLWAVASWRSCASCGLSVAAKPPAENAV